tara:strand:- start:6476 stop:8926 length:2451 start_codon:yes stop_codon:yes gene_type:complete
MSMAVIVAITFDFADQAYADDFAREPSPQSQRFFESEIRPLLIEHCHQCHAGDTAEGGLRLDSGQAIREGGDSGPVLVAHDPQSSLIVSAIRYESIEMPPDEPLSDEQQDLIADWVAKGARWSDAFEDAVSVQLDSKPQDWWASQPLVADDFSEAEVNASSPTRIDHEIDVQLNANGMSRADPVDRARLIRRLSFDLLGIPPTLQQVDDFVRDCAPDAYERLVDRMFANPAYGERMARLWLDLVRYAESDGWRQDAYRPSAYRYRQWVADAFNEGMPYDHFVAMQLAGDEIAPNDPSAKVAAGFLRLGIFEYNQRDAEGQWQNIVDEITDVTADVFLATGMACAKCHDHKFDPIPRADYFRLRSVFEPVVFVDQKPERNGAKRHAGEINQLRQELKALEGSGIDELRQVVVEKFTLDLQEMYRKPTWKKNSYEQQLSYLILRQTSEEGLSDAKIKKKLGAEAFDRRTQILARLRELGADPYPDPNLLTVQNASGEIRLTRIPGRSQGRHFDPGVPQVFGGHDLVTSSMSLSSSKAGRRTALARWMTSPDNPIAARVLANRLWQYHFGTGLVNSANDFGNLGTQPTHPRLLDYLAKRLHETKWNVQAVQKEIVCSATYRQSSVHPNASEYSLIDARNQWLWRYPLRRLDAEQYRDTLLQAAGTLDRVYGGPSVTESKKADEPQRRALYLQRKRNAMEPMLQLMDAAGGLVSAAKRDETVTAPQALMMLNSPRVNSIAEQFCQRVLRDLDDRRDRNDSHEEDDMQVTQFVRHAHRLATGVEIDPAMCDELASLAAKGQEGKVDVCHVLLNSNALLFIE